MEEEMVFLYKGSRKMEIPLSEKQKWINRGWQEEPPEGVSAEED